MATALKILDRMNETTETAAELTAYFTEQCGMKKLPWMAKEFEKLLKQGFEPDLLEEIIDRTARAARPSWAYLSTIIAKARYNDAYDLASFLLVPRYSGFETSKEIFSERL